MSFLLLHIATTIIVLFLSIIIIMHAYTYTHLSIYIYTYVCVCVCVRVHVCVYICLSVCLCVCKHMYAKMKHTHDQENHFSLRKKTMRPFCQEIAIRAVARFSSNPKRVASAVAWEAQPSPAAQPPQEAAPHRVSDTVASVSSNILSDSTCRDSKNSMSDSMSWDGALQNFGGNNFSCHTQAQNVKTPRNRHTNPENILKVPSFWCFQSLVSSGKFGSLRKSLAASTLSSTRTEEKSRPTWQRKLEVTNNRQQNGS